MEDFPVVPIAMVIIAFLSWLRNRLQTAAEIRRERSAAKAEAARARRTTAPAKPAYESPYREEPVRRSPRREVAEEIMPKTFRELFDEINAQQEVASAASPPPLPPPVTKAPSEDPKEEARGDGDRFDPITTANAAPQTTRRSGKRAKHSLVETLSDGDRLSNALILREILGPPKALSGRSRRP